MLIISESETCVLSADCNNPNVATTEALTVVYSICHTIEISDPPLATCAANEVFEFELLVETTSESSPQSSGWSSGEESHFQQSL